jgi:hypothetical protein
MGRSPIFFLMVITDEDFKWDAFSVHLETYRFSSLSPPTFILGFFT